jgi:hypothetical protein
MNGVGSRVFDHWKLTWIVVSIITTSSSSIRNILICELVFMIHIPFFKTTRNISY